MKKILITGIGSYIGTSVESWLNNWPEKYSISSIDMRLDSWKSIDFSEFDIVFHVAGIAHVSMESKLEDLYNRVNRDLAIETANKAKRDGIKQFIFMSSMIVYTGVVPKDGTVRSECIPNPNDLYGRSKYQAEQGINILQDDSFNVVILRPPMIYGKGSKGNYPKLAKSARHFPIFPYYINNRSMLHIDNLCEFIRLMVENEEKGIFFPQNSEYIRTSDLVSEIAKAHNKKVRLTKIFNPLLRFSIKRIGIVGKVFGNLVYEKSMSVYKDNYNIRSFHESINLTEK